MLGAPGSGKGTYAKALASSTELLLSKNNTTTTTSSLPIISTGDIIRDEITRNTSLGKAAQQAAENGQLVPDAIITDIVLKRLSSFDADSLRPTLPSPGYILDGFPRTPAQAQSLLEYEGGKYAPTAVININLATDVIVQKLAGRRVCTKCGTSYNIANVVDSNRGYDMPAMPPPKECEETLTIRKDDDPKIVKERLLVYERETAPLIELYQETGLLIDFQVKKGMKEMPLLLKKIVKHGEASQLADEWSKV